VTDTVPHGPALSKVGHDRYLKFVWKVAVVACAFVGGPAALS